MVSEDFFSEDGPLDVFNFIGLAVWGGEKELLP
jgi:hypothetical protein